MVIPTAVKAVKTAVDFGINPDGVADTKAKIQNYIDYASQTNGTALLQSGDHKVTGTLSVPTQTSLAGQEDWGTAIVPVAGQTGNVIETKDYATKLGANDQYAVEGYVCRPTIRDLVIDGINTDNQGGFSVWENGQWVAYDTRSASTRTAIAMVASGQAVRRIHIYQFPGTGVIVDRGTGTLVGVHRREDWENAVLDRITMMGVLAGVHIRTGADPDLSNVSIGNFRDFGIKIEGTACNIHGSNHVYGGATVEGTDTKGIAFILGGTGHTVDGQLQADAVRKGILFSGSEHTVSKVILKFLAGINSSGVLSAGMGVDFASYSNTIEFLRCRNVYSGTTIVDVKATGTDSTIGFFRCDLSGGVLGSNGSNVTAANIQSHGMQICESKMIINGAGGAMSNFIGLNIGTTGGFAPSGGKFEVDLTAANSPSNLTAVKINNIGKGNRILVFHRGSTVTALSNPNAVSLSGNYIRTVNVDTGVETSVGSYL